MTFSNWAIFLMYRSLNWSYDRTVFTAKRTCSYKGIFRVPAKINYFDSVLLASERSERDTLRSVQSRIADIYIIIYIYIVRANFVLITRKEGGA